MDPLMPQNSPRTDLKGIEDEINALTRTVEQAMGQMKELFEDANCFCKIKSFSNLSAAHKQGYAKWAKIRNNASKKLQDLRIEGRILARERLRNPQAPETQRDASSYKRERIPRSMPQRPLITRITDRSLITSGRHQRPTIEPRKSQYLSANMKGRHILPGKGLLANWEAFQMSEGHEDPFECIVSDSSDRENDEDMEELLWESKRKKAVHKIRGRVAIEHFTSLHDSDNISDFKRSQIVKRVQAKKDAADRLKSAPPLDPYPPRPQSTFNQLRQNGPQGQTVPVSIINPRLLSRQPGPGEDKVPHPDTTQPSPKSPSLPVESMLESPSVLPLMIQDPFTDNGLEFEKDDPSSDGVLDDLDFGAPLEY